MSSKNKRKRSAGEKGDKSIKKTKVTSNECDKYEKWVQRMCCKRNNRKELFVKDYCKWQSVGFLPLMLQAYCEVTGAETCSKRLIPIIFGKAPKSNVTGWASMVRYGTLMSSSKGYAPGESIDKLPKDPPMCNDVGGKCIPCTILSRSKTGGPKALDMWKKIYHLHLTIKENGHDDQARIWWEHKDKYMKMLHKIACDY